VKGEGWKGAMGGAVLYATSGLGALALASGKVRDYLMKGVAIRDWPVTASRREVATITEELEVALQKIAPDAKAVVVRPFSPESWNKGIESSPAETLGRVGRVEHARRELSPGSAQADDPWQQ
jgi:hypothetical protein